MKKYKKYSFGTIYLNGINSKYFFILVEHENWKGELTAETVDCATKIESFCQR